MLKNKIIKLLVGTNNKGKLREIKDLLPKNLEIYSPEDFKIKSPPENGKTFKENSLIKAKFFSKKSKMTCLSDDSGLEIDALNGDPGIYSARWGGKKGDFKKAMNRVFKELDKKDKDWRKKKIKARFICALTIYNKNKEVINRQLEATKDRFDVGDLTITDVSQAEARLSDASANLVKSEADLNIAKAVFFQIQA